jgi:hypothetical protein
MNESKDGGVQMKRLIRSVTLLLLLGMAASQLIRPNTVNPPVDPTRSLWNDHRVDPRVADILRRACADCHSHETTWPWYSKISPVSWLVARHVIQGRAKLNFSEWSGATADQLEEIADSIDKQKMPMASYLLIHPKGRLSKEDREVLLAWADGKLQNASR